MIEKKYVIHSIIDCDEENRKCVEDGKPKLYHSEEIIVESRISYSVRRRVTKSCVNQSSFDILKHVKDLNERQLMLDFYGDAKEALIEIEQLILSIPPYGFSGSVCDELSKKFSELRKKITELQ